MQQQNQLLFETVDLGLSVLWATCNLGSINPEQSGNFYSWGEISPKKSYKKSTYRFYVDDNEGMSNAHGKDCDAAFSSLGEGWRLPTKREVEELLAKCDCQPVTRNSVNGVLCTSRINGNSCFFPASGIYDERGLGYVNFQGNYWTASQSFEEDMNAMAFFVNRQNMGLCESCREKGLMIRPVKSQDWEVQEMFQPEKKIYPESQYSWGYKKSGPKLRTIYYIVIIVSTILWGIVCFNSGLLFGGRLGFLVLSIPPAAIGFIMHPMCFNKNEIND